MAAAREGTIVDQPLPARSEKIGSGGMADVWLAEDRELDREVAMKILHDRFAQDKEFVERFRREAQSAAGLQHPNVVSIFDRGEFDDTYFIAMEYVERPPAEGAGQGRDERPRTRSTSPARSSTPPASLTARGSSTAT